MEKNTLTMMEEFNRALWTGRQSPERRLQGYNPHACQYSRTGNVTRSGHYSARACVRICWCVCLYGTFRQHWDSGPGLLLLSIRPRRPDFLEQSNCRHTYKHAHARPHVGGASAKGHVYKEVPNAVARSGRPSGFLWLNSAASSLSEPRLLQMTDSRPSP